MTNGSIRNLYYITHINNLPSILKFGILSHNQIIEKKIDFTPIYEESVVNRRQSIKTPDGRSLWDFANVYFQARNPMLYRVMLEKSKEEIIVIAISPSILKDKCLYFADGNAACNETAIWPIKEAKSRLPKMLRGDLAREYWSSTDGSKRRIMAECLVPGSIRPELINQIFVPSYECKISIQKIIGIRAIPIIPEPKMFFLPYLNTLIAPNISIVTGDMFFSKYQTLTVSVNTVGIMGKGLASRTKYQFPDVYVMYQDLCRRKTLRMGKPYLYKRAKSLDEELADESKTLPTSNDEKWFLLFATKNHWREMGNTKGIEEGLGWVRSNLKIAGAKSLAIPALGCGQGWLEWKDVGPIMCRYLISIEIPVEIYLPLETKTKKEFLTKEFLLSGLAP